MSDLMPCPFCGAEQDDCGDLDNDAYFCQSSSGTLAIGCSRCICIGPEGKGRAEAIAAWNTRTVQAQIDAGRDAALQETLRAIKDHADEVQDSNLYDEGWQAAVRSMEQTILALIRKGGRP
jgi:hypothetical protein